MENILDFTVEVEKRPDRMVFSLAIRTLSQISDCESLLSTLTQFLGLQEEIGDQQIELILSPMLKPDLSVPPILQKRSIKCR